MSKFAEREDVSSAAAIPVHTTAERALILNFSQEDPHSNDAQFHQSFARASQVLGALLDGSRTGYPLPVNAPRNERRLALDVVSAVFDGAVPNAVNVARELRRAALHYGGSSSRQATVYGLRGRLDAGPSNEDPLTPISSGQEECPPAYGVVKACYEHGWTFFCEDINQGLRQLYTELADAPVGMPCKATIPIRCEPIFLELDKKSDGEVTQVREIYRTRYVETEKPKRYIYGVLDVQAESRAYGRESLIDLSLLACLTASAILFREAMVQCKLETYQRTLLYDGIGEALKNLKSLNDLENPQTNALKPVCDAVVQSELLEGVDRFDIWGYDHSERKFNLGGYAIGKKIEMSSKGLTLKEYLQYVQPRAGGQSEELLQIHDEYRIIANAREDPKVSRLTKSMGITSLIGVSCRLAASFKSEGVIWLGSHNETRLDSDYLKKNEGKNLKRVQMLQLLAAIFAMIARLR